MSPKYRMSRSGLQPYDQPRHLDPHRRMYSTYRWQKMRARQIRRQPFCADAGPDCAGPLTADHIVPVSEGGDPFDFSNLTTRCRHHNSAKGAR